MEPEPPTSNIDAEGLSGDSFEVTRPAVILSLEAELVPVGIPPRTWPRDTGIGKELARIWAELPRYYRSQTEKKYRRR